MRRAVSAATAAVGVAALLACTGLFRGGADGIDPEVDQALESIDATVLAARSESDPMIFDLEGGGKPPGDAGTGVQIAHVAPLGDSRKPLQAAVVFDGPMVPLTDLDGMSDSLPL